MDEYFSIGEVSKATKIPISTLRYYDSEKVLSPAVKDEHTKYRYYSGFQIPLLKIISHLRKLGFSIEHIKSHFENKDYGHTKELIERTIFETRSEIERLQNVEKELLDSLSEFQKLDEIKATLGQPFLEETEEVKGMIFPGPFHGVKDIGKKINDIDFFESANTIKAEFRGIKLSRSNWETDKFIKEALITIASEPAFNRTEIISKGMCVCIHGQGMYERTEDIEYLLNWMEKHNLKAAEEFFIFFSALCFPFKSPKDFLYTIKIPVIKE